MVSIMNEQSVATAAPSNNNNAANTGVRNNNNNNNNNQSPAALLSLQRSRVISPGTSRITPTRTIRLTEIEQQQAVHRSPVLLSADALARRPRSNPHSRTPMRYESPLNNNEFRNVRHSSSTEQQQQPERSSNGIFTERGLMVSTTTTTRSRSNKQDNPGHRKLRRWKNDSFINLASEMPSAQTAAILRQAEKDAHLYRSVYDPKEHQPSQQLQKFMYDSEMKYIRDQFFEGQIGVDVSNTNDEKRMEGKMKYKLNPITIQDCVNRIDSRLRRIVIRACTNSYAAAKVIRLFESFLMKTFCVVDYSNKKKKNSNHKKIDDEFGNDVNKNKLFLDDDGDSWWDDLLLECPTITERTDGKYTVQFFFPDSACINNNNNDNNNNNTGGFHRILVHAVAQFHGLHVTSRTVQYCNNNNNNTQTATGSVVDNNTINVKTLIVTGNPIVVADEDDMRYVFRLVDHLEGKHHDPRDQQSLHEDRVSNPAITVVSPMSNKKAHASKSSTNKKKHYVIEGESIEKDEAMEWILIQKPIV